MSFAQLTKVYGAYREGEQRYSPAEVLDTVPCVVLGKPDRGRIYTSHIGCQNLSIRMGMRRMTRLRSSFSKKWENLEAAYALWFAYYNLCRIHSSPRVTPAVEAGITTSPWGIDRLLTVNSL